MDPNTAAEQLCRVLHNRSYNSQVTSQLRLNQILKNAILKTHEQTYYTSPFLLPDVVELFLL